MMIADTNILVRYAIKDDRNQTIKATEFLKNNQCHMLKTVLLELVWVLSSAAGYNLPRTVVVERVRHLCGLPCIEVEDSAAAAQALSWYAAGMDFADALHLASTPETAGFVTFDKRLTSKACNLLSQNKIILL